MLGVAGVARSSGLMTALFAFLPRAILIQHNVVAQGQRQRSQDHEHHCSECYPSGCSYKQRPLCHDQGGPLEFYYLGTIIDAARSLRLIRQGGDGGGMKLYRGCQLHGCPGRDLAPYKPLTASLAHSALDSIFSYAEPAEMTNGILGARMHPPGRCSRFSPTPRQATATPRLRLPRTLWPQATTDPCHLTRESRQSKACRGAAAAVATCVGCRPACMKGARLSAE